MATNKLLPPACAFAASVLEEYAKEPDAVPEEAVEAAREHIAACPQCGEGTAKSRAVRAPAKKRGRRSTAEMSAASPKTASATSKKKVSGDTSASPEPTLASSPAAVAAPPARAAAPTAAAKTAAAPPAESAASAPAQQSSKAIVP